MTVIVNILQNAYACYMKLSHYKEALKCVNYIKSLMPDYLKTYLLYGQLAYFNRLSTLPELRKTLQTLKEGIAVGGLAVANSQSYLPLFKSLEQMRELIEQKIERRIKERAQQINDMFMKACKIDKNMKEKGVQKEFPRFARAYDDFKVVAK